jgi:2-oxoglutarate dehydrogenase E2 component (dihydrolipoamide succinyltransferase)
MSLVDLVMPKMGESIMEATILKWHKQPGDAVKQDETLLEIATDKVDSEVPSVTEGILEEILYQVNDVVPIGSVIARIRTNGTSVSDTRLTNSGQQATAPAQSRTPVQTSWASSHAPAAQYETAAEIAHSQPGNRFYSPLVLNIAASEGVPLSELESIPGTGNEGRVTKKDILQYVAAKRGGGTPYTSQTASAQTGTPAYRPAISQPASHVPPPAIHVPQPAAQSYEAQPAQSPASPAIYTGNVEIVEMDRMRRLISEHMVRSKHTSAHVTSFAEADVTHLVQWREKVKKEFEKREGTKITFTPLFIEAIIKCIKQYPIVNSSVDGDKIIIKKDVNIGMATALPSGNLIVPVIRNADQLNLTGLARQVNMLADNARNNKLKPEDTQGGTFTLTNVGTFGSLMGTPIINQPQVAILAVGTIKKRPVVLETEEGDAIVIRHMMYLSLSYDHRIVDGSVGATFLSAVARELENFPTDRAF